MRTYSPDQLLANETEQVFRQFMYMPNEHAYTVATLWVMHTHLRNADGVFLPYVTPRLYYGSKIAGCGKSLVTEITTKLSHNGEVVLEPTTPSVTTLMNNDQATIGFDEIDTFFGRGTGKQAMRAILNGGYKRGAKVTRQRSDETDRQNCHGPIVMNGKNANLFMTHDNFETLRTRSISVILEQKPADYEVDRFNPELHDARLLNLMGRLKKWGVVNARAILSIPIDGLMPARIANRAEEIWTVLFRIAEYLGAEWPDRVEAAAKAFVLGEWQEDDTPVLTPTEELLAHVRAVFRTDEAFLPTSLILERLEALPTRAAIMSEWHSERAATMGLSRALAVYGIESLRATYDGHQVRGYDRADLFEEETAPAPVRA